jgi:serine/threonine-protein kinase
MMQPLPEVAAPSPRIETLHSSGTSDVYTAPLSGGGPLAIVKRTKITCARDIERFERELELLCAVSHECVIRPLGVVHAPPTYALVLPLFSRGSLFRLLHNSAAVLSARCRVSLALDAFAAVAHLHAAGVIHRDIKPDNLLIADDGRAVLTDFNAAELSANVTGEITVQVRGQTLWAKGGPWPFPQTPRCGAGEL